MVSYVAHQYSRVGFDLSVEVNLRLYCSGVGYGSLHHTRNLCLPVRSCSDPDGGT